MLRDLGIESVRVMTNNPLKVEALRRDGVLVSSRVEHFAGYHLHNHEYLETKRRRMGHLYDLGDEEARPALASGGELD